MGVSWRWVVRGELDEDSQKLQTFSYKINKSWVYNLQLDTYNERCYILYADVIKRINPKSSHHKKKFFFYVFNFVSI